MAKLGLNKGAMNYWKLKGHIPERHFAEIAEHLGTTEAYLRMETENPEREAPSPEMMARLMKLAKDFNVIKSDGTFDQEEADRLRKQVMAVREAVSKLAEAGKALQE